MEKLAAADAGFLYSETGKCTSNIASVNVLELPERVTATEYISTLKTYLSERAHLVAYMQRKLAFVPGNWDHPVWVPDENFDINNHVIEYPVPAPGGRAEMEHAVASIHEIRMPLERPLWAWHILTGLEGNKLAIYNQAHHAALDGASGNAAYVTLMDETPDHPEIAPVTNDMAAPEEFSMLSMFEQSFQNFLRFQMDSAPRMMGTVEASRRLMIRALDPSKDFGAYAKIAPKTPFNRQISEKRAWATAEIPLLELKTMGKKVDATINDMVMAICAGGLREYLIRHDALPETGLIAGCPVSLRKPGDTKPGTQVTMMNVDLGTEIENPIERIIAVRASSATAKEIVSDMASAIENNASIPGMPAIMDAQMNAAESLGLANYVRGPINVVISNVPGPREALYANQAQMQTHYPVSIAAHGMALNITVQSYRNQLFMGITACAESVPDLETLRDDILKAYRDLNQRLLPNISEFKPKYVAVHTGPDQEMQQKKVA